MIKARPTDRVSGKTAKMKKSRKAAVCKNTVAPVVARIGTIIRAYLSLTSDGTIIISIAISASNESFIVLSRDPRQ